MLNLVDAINELEKRIRQKTVEFNKELEKMEATVKYLKEMNEACPICNGKGKILRDWVYAEDDRPDPDDPRDWRPCSVCNGTGRVQKDVK